MKNVLFASTALVAFAGAASADVLISGSAEMGIYNSDGMANDNGGDTEFFQDVDVTFTMTGETDGGLAFGASVDLDEAGGLGNEDNDNGFTVFISGAFGTLTMGDTDGAMDWAIQDVDFNAGSINDDATEHAGYLGGNPFDGLYDGQILRYNYNVGDFGVAVSAQMDDGRDGGGVNVARDGGDSDPVLGLGFTYNLDLGGNAIRFGLGYEETEVGATSNNAAGTALVAGDWDAIGVSISGTFGATSAGISYINVDAPTAAESYDHTAVGVGYSMGAISLHANYGIFDYDDGDESDGYGLTAGYDLGGGASIVAGYGNGTDTVAGVDTDTDSFSLGVSMSF